MKFNRGLADGFFSTKKHALVASDEKLLALQRELNRHAMAPAPRLPSDPESLKKRLDEALVEADKQAERLEASSAAREGNVWWGTLNWVGPPLAILFAAYAFRRSRA